MNSAGDSGLALEVAEEIQDVGRGRRVERRGRFVEQEQLGLAGEGEGDHRALILAARHLVRILPGHQRCIRQAHHREQALRLRCNPGRRDGPVTQQHLPNVFAEGEGGVERGTGVLEDHRDPVAANRGQPALVQLAKRDVSEPDFPGLRGDRRAQRPHDRVGKRALAGAGLADQAEHFAGLDCEAHVLQHLERAASRGVGDAVVVHGEGRVAHPMLRSGGSAHRAAHPRAG